MPNATANAAPSTAVVGPATPYSAAAVYGGAPAPQPTPTGTPDHAPGTPEPVARTMPNAGARGIIGNPMAALVAIIGVALLLARFSVR